MIFVTVGTHKCPFKRLAFRIEEFLAAEPNKYQFVIQFGYTPINASSAVMRRFVSRDEINELNCNADIVICHGGTGSLITALKAGKKVVAAARSACYGEHNDEHQTEIVSFFSGNGWVMSWDLDRISLGEVIDAASNWMPSVTDFNWPSLIPNLQDYLEAE